MSIPLLLLIRHLLGGRGDGLLIRHRPLICHGIWRISGGLVAEWRISKEGLYGEGQALNSPESC
jgi:hypothetical protein